MTSAQPILVTIGPYTVTCTAGLPSYYGRGTVEGTLIDEFDLDASDGDLCCIEVSSGDDSSSLIVAQRNSPGTQAGFYPGILVVPETQIAFIGVGERVEHGKELTSWPQDRVGRSGIVNRWRSHEDLRI